MGAVDTSQVELRQKLMTIANWPTPIITPDLIFDYMDFSYLAFIKVMEDRKKLALAMLKIEDDETFRLMGEQMKYYNDQLKEIVVL